MKIKSPQTLVQDALNQVKTISASDAALPGVDFDIPENSLIHLSTTEVVLL